MNVVVAVAGISIVSALFLSTFHSTLFSDRQMQVRQVVESIYSLLAHYGELEKQGVMTREAAQAAALKAVEDIRYGDDGYFWINDHQPKMVMHPIKPKLNGQYLGEIKDPQGKPLFKAFVSKAESDPEGGFVDYLWPKVGKDDPQPKVSFVKDYPAWQWIIGSGLYVDDVNGAFISVALKTLSGVGVIGLLIVGISIWLGRSILLPVKRLEQTMTAVQARNNLSIRTDVTDGSELGRMGNAFNHMMDKLQAFVTEVEQAIHTIKTDAVTLSDVADVTLSAIDREQMQASEVATAMNEMSVTVNEIASNANATALLTSDTNREAKAVKGVVDETIVTIDALSKDVSRATLAIQELDQSAETIGGVLDVIQSIAEQTNLLALNAAIEAARAGEQGRGFAVVADEVRNLANRTQQSTNEIQEIIQAVQGGAKNAVKVMASGQAQADQCVQQVNSAGHAIESINSFVSEIEARSKHIATAAEQQSQVASEINRNVHEIKTLSSENVASSKQTARFSHDLMQLSDSLNDMMLRMHDQAG
ncbi:MAG: methyl-accepting chemotaxis protein [Candidatus Thiodiazotropha sp.]